MIFIDGIVFSLQATGGISVVFSELIQRFVGNDIPFKLAVFGQQTLNWDQKYIEHQKARIAERYRRCRVIGGASLFHSTYYRVPVSRKLPVVTTVHDFTYERFFTGPRKWMHSMQKFYAIQRADAIICISEATKKDLLDFLPEIHSDKIHVVYNGVGDKFFPLDSSVRVNNTIQPYMLFVGSRAGYKNFDDAINAVAAINGLTLRCVGGGPLNLEEKTSLDKKLKGRYWHVENATTEELNTLYNQALGLLYPSSYEGFGLPVLEAMRTGCPVIAVNSSSIPEVAGDAAILVESSTPELLTQAIVSLQSPETRTVLREKGFARSQLFSWDKTFAQTVKVYEKVLGINYTTS